MSIASHPRNASSPLADRAAATAPAAAAPPDALLADSHICPAHFMSAAAEQLKPWVESGIEMSMLDHLYCIRKQVARVLFHNGETHHPYC